MSDPARLLRERLAATHLPNGGDWPNFETERAIDHYRVTGDPASYEYVLLRVFDLVEAVAVDEKIFDRDIRSDAYAAVAASVWRFDKNRVPKSWKVMWGKKRTKVTLIGFLRNLRIRAVVAVLASLL